MTKPIPERMLTPGHTGRIDSPEGALSAAFALRVGIVLRSGMLYRFALLHSFSRWHEPDECLADQTQLREDAVLSSGPGRRRLSGRSLPQFPFATAGSRTAPFRPTRKRPLVC